jgi:hypothetical protein
VLFAGVSHAQYATLSEAVQKIPDLSDLAKHTKGNPFEKSLNDPAFVGTVFAPTNAVRHFAACKARLNGFESYLESV